MLKNLCASMIALACCVSLTVGQDQRPQKPSPKEWAKEHPKAAEKIRENADRNEDGKLGAKERKEAREETLEAMRRAHRKEAFECFQKEHPEMAAKLKERADQNGDGKVDPMERKQAMARFEEFEAKRWRQRQLEHFDKDGDGKLSEDEKCAAREWMKEHHPRPEGETSRESMKERFDRVDRDDDGKIEPKERAFDRADKNDDGKIGPKEKERMREQMKERFDRVDRNDDGKIGPKEKEMVRERKQEQARPPQPRPAPKR